VCKSERLFLSEEWGSHRQRYEASTVNNAALVFVVCPELALGNLFFEKAHCHVRRALIGAEERALLDRCALM
jgi:hypothetical protein